MNANELRDKTPDQLREELANLKKESFNLRFQQATGQLENPAQIRKALFVKDDNVVPLRKETA